jgi:hypothetical protein
MNNSVRGYPQLKEIKRILNENAKKPEGSGYEYSEQEVKTIIDFFSEVSKPVSQISDADGVYN